MRGFEPTIRIASASSMPAMVGVEEIGGAAVAPDRSGVPSWRQSMFGDAEALHQQLQREHLLDGREVAGDGADALRRRALHPRRRSCANASCQDAGRRRPFSRTIGPVEALQAQAVDDLAGLVGDPLLVHRLVDARQDAHDLAAARIDADGRADRIHHVDRFGLGQLPGPHVEVLRLVDERADRAEVGDVALELGAASPVRDRS